MNTQQKEKIKEALKTYCAQQGSQNAAANTLNNVSAATISQILKGNWDNIAGTMWNRIAKQLGVNDEWVFVETNTTQAIKRWLIDAQVNGNCHAICFNAGGGKSATAKRFASETSNAFFISASEYFNRKTFLATTLQSMGKDCSGTVAELVDRIVRTIEELEDPTIMIDEADKLSDQVLSFFITFFNKMEDKCALVLMGTGYLEKRIEKGLRLGRRGYEEINSRIGLKCIKPNVSNAQLKEDIKTVCEANGITNTLQITEIINDSYGDFRRVKKLVHKFKNKQN